MSYTKKELKDFRAMWRQDIIDYVTDLFGSDVNLEYYKGGLFELMIDSMRVDFALNYYTGQIVDIAYGRNQSHGPNSVWRVPYKADSLSEITDGLVTYATDIIAGAAFLRDLQKLHFTVLHPELPSKLKKGNDPELDYVHTADSSYRWSSEVDGEDYEDSIEYRYDI